jgi:hypothetical protein
MNELALVYRKNWIASNVPEKAVCGVIHVRLINIRAQATRYFLEKYNHV